MKKILFILLFFLLTNISKAQFEYRGAEYYSYDEGISMFLEADNESRKTNNKDSFIFRMLKVYHETENGAVEILRKELSSENGNTSYKFSSFCEMALRKFVVIQGLRNFYIYDIRKKQLSEILEPRFWGITKTKDNHILQNIKVSENGNSIFGINTESGAFLYNVCDLSSPKESMSLNLPFFSQSRVFEIPNCKNNGKYSGVYVSQSDDDIIIETLFVDKKLHSQTDNSIANLSYDEIEEIIMDTPISQGRYAIFKENTPKKNKFIVVDVIKGKIIKLPTNKIFATKKELLIFLSEM